MRGVDRDRAVALDERFAAAFNGVIARWPSVFGGSDLDPDANRKRMEALVRRMEDLAKSLGGPTAGADASISPTARLATMLREALAANTIGGRVDEETRWKTSEYEVRAAQDAWRQVGFVPDADAAPLLTRFQRACQRFYGQRRPTASGPGSGHPGPRGPRGAGAPRNRGSHPPRREPQPH